jgi:hypothetical protein
MFVRERLEADAREMAAMYLRSQEDEARTFETYRKWFAAKGYWPGESATGEEESHEQDH